jgi:hypothetical protein
MRALALIPLLFLLGATPSPVSLPPLPETIWSQIGPVQVERVANLMCGAGVPAMGCFDGTQMTVYVRDSIPLNIAWQTLEHEKVHVALYLSGLSLGVAEDHAADILASARVAEMLAK